MESKNDRHGTHGQKDGTLTIRLGMATSLVMLATGALVLGHSSFASASIGFYVGKNLTKDGSVFLAGYGDEPSSHWVEVVPRRRYPAETKIKVGATEKARYPGELIEIPQVSETYKYITSNYSAFAGFPAPLTNGGLNEHHVAARDIWSPSRTELRRMTPNPQRGLNYSDLSRIVMERARTARQAVKLVGDLIDQYGFCTYGGNSHLFADKNEGWIVINFAGGQGLWVAERLGPDSVRVSHPGYILEIPLDYKENPNYMGSNNLISFAVEQGWFDPQSGEPFNVNKIYGNGQERAELVIRFEQRLAKLAPHICLEDMIAIVRTTEATDDRSGYGQVAHLRDNVHRELGVLWLATSCPVTTPFVPLRLGITDVPPEYKRHRYLTEGEAAGFMDPSFQGLESTQYAFRAYKRLYYLVNEHPDKFLDEVTEVLTAFEHKLITQQELVERTALALHNSGEPQLARAYLTYYCRTEAVNGLQLVETLAQSIEARTKTLFGIREPKSKE